MKKQILSTLLLSTMALSPVVSFAEDVIIGQDSGAAVIAVDETIDSGTADIVIGGETQTPSVEETKTEETKTPAADIEIGSETKTETPTPVTIDETVDEISAPETKPDAGNTIIPISNTSEEKTTPEETPAAIEKLETPIVTEKGYEVVAVKGDEVLVKTEDGNVETKAAEEVGFKKEDKKENEKSSSNKLEVLPTTGESSDLVQVLLGLGLLGVVAALTYRDKLKTFFKKNK